MFSDIDEFRENFDSMYVGSIPQLLNDNGAFLAFLAIVAATDALAGFLAPKMGTGERFRAFVTAYFPKALGERAEDLWTFRNLMVHSFNPGPFTLTCHQSRLHLTAQEGQLTLNAEDFYAHLVTASRAYFEALDSDDQLKRNFLARLAEEDGGVIQSFSFQRRRLNGTAA